MTTVRCSLSSRFPEALKLLVLAIALTAATVQSAYTSISTASQLKGFAQEVNAGTSYLGSTVTLANDIDMSGVTDFPAIGLYGNPFRGVFNGKGYRIKNLRISTSSIRYAGLFGYTNGCTIKNVVIDSSCYIENSESQTGYAAGVVGYANAGANEASVLNCVNMGTIVGKGPYSKVGGIASFLYATYPSKIINCANTGRIEYAGSAERSWVGGIVGWMGGYEGNVPSVINCVNLGEIKLTTQPSLVGGIVGNCTVSTGVINNNYWLSGTAAQCYNGNAAASGNNAFNSEYKLSSDTSLVDALNSYVSSQSSLGLRQWGAVAFATNGGTAVSPRLTMWFLLGAPDTTTKTGHEFEGWFADTGFTQAIDVNKRYGSGAGDTFYAKWSVNQYTVHFETGGISDIQPIREDFSTTITLQTLNRTGYTFDGWGDDKENRFTESYTINRAEDVTLTALWTPNQYTVTFNAAGGDFLNESESAKSVTYDQQYGDLPVPKRVGYTFVGWFTERTGGEPIINETIFTTPNDRTLYAQWEINNYTLTFDFGNGTALPEVLDFGESFEYPEVLERAGYKFLGWDSNITRMPANDTITILCVICV